MTKKELIKEMSKTLNSTQEAKKALESLLSKITDALKKGDSVTLTGFGTFQVSKRRARTGVNPRTGEKIEIKAKTVARFIAGKHLKDTIN